MKVLRLSFVEDDLQVVETVREGFAGGDVTLFHAPTIADGHRLLATQQYDALILDLSLPDGCTSQNIYPVGIDQSQQNSDD